MRGRSRERMPARPPAEKEKHEKEKKKKTTKHPGDGGNGDDPHGSGDDGRKKGKKNQGRKPRKPNPPDEPGESSDTSDEQGRSRAHSPGRKQRTKEAPKVEVPTFPTISRLAAYKLTMLENLVCASGREDHQLVAAWALLVEQKGTKLEDLAP